MITNSLLYQINLGRSGRNQGYSLGLPKLESVIDGVLQSVYTLIFGPTGSGKSTLALYSYVYRPIMDHLDDGNFTVTYYSLEMSSELIFGKLLCMYLFETYGIELSTKELLSRKRGFVLDDETYAKIKESMPWLHKIESHINIIDKALNAEILYASLSKELEREGIWETKEDGRKIYIKNNDELVHLVVIDHLSLVRPTNGRTKKEEMDTISSYLVTLRNRCKISPLVIMQTNRTSTSMDRKKAGLDNMMLSDIKDSGSPSEDSEVVISIFSPHRERLATHNHYNIGVLRDNFRGISVLKNRWGESDIEIGCAFSGKIGLFKEMPKGEEITDFNTYTNISYFKEDIQEEKKDTEIKSDISKNNFYILQ